MSGEAGNQPASPSVSPAPPTSPPVPLADRSGYALKARIWFGLPLAVIGGYLLGDTAGRFQLAWDAFVAWWPWALLGLAVANVLRSVLQLESLLAPGLLAFVALVGLALRGGIAANMFTDFAVPGALALTGMALLASAGSWLTRSWTRVLVTGRVSAYESASGSLRPKAILGELRADLSPLTAPPQQVNVTAVFGHVHLTVPTTWRLDLHATGALLTPIRGVVGSGPSEVKLRVLGFRGVVSVARAVQASLEANESPQA